jgi:hypothetical protein
VRQKKPVASPGNVAVYFAVMGNLHFDNRREAATRKGVHRYRAVTVQKGALSPHRSLHAVLAGIDPLHKGEGRHHADCPVAAHAEIIHMIKEDDPRSGIRGRRRAQ